MQSGGSLHREDNAYTDSATSGLLSEGAEKAVKKEKEHNWQITVP